MLLKDTASHFVSQGRRLSLQSTTDDVDVEAAAATK